MRLKLLRYDCGACFFDATGNILLPNNSIFKSWSGSYIRKVILKILEAVLSMRFFRIFQFHIKRATSSKKRKSCIGNNYLNFSSQKLCANFSASFIEMKRDEKPLKPNESCVNGHVRISDGMKPTRWSVFCAAAAPPRDGWTLQQLCFIAYRTEDGNYCPCDIKLCRQWCTASVNAASDEPANLWLLFRGKQQ